MAKTSMKIKQQMAPKFSTRAYNRCKICGRPHAYLRKYGICRICFRELANASTAKHPSVDIPASNLKKAIANILLEEGYVKGVQVIADDKQGVIRIALKYTETGAPVISGIRRVSKPGLRIYTNCEDMPKVMKGLGTAIISTSKGVMTDKAARANNVGGEVLAFVW